MSDSDEIMHDDASSEALAPGSKLLSGQYEILSYLSSGGFGITYLARDSLNRTVVIKECFPEAFCSRVNKTVRARTRNYIEDFKSIVQLFIREAHALSRLDHDSVVGVHQVFEDNETAYMALDLVDGKDLLDIIESGEPKMTAAQVRDLTLALLDAIGHVHSQDLLHRDISPDNILVDAKGRPVLIDFGAAREEASRKSRVLSAVLVVKDGYSPQEFYVAGSQQNPCSDLYALAATLVHLITGKAPANSQARLSALASNQPDLYEPLQGRFPEYEESFLEAIDKTMNIVPAERLQSAEDWVLMIDHTKRVEIARAKAESDKTIDVTVMNLVKSVKVPPAPLVDQGETGISKSDQASKTNHNGAALAKADSKPTKPTEDLTPAVENLAADELIESLLKENAQEIVQEDVQAEPVRQTPYGRVKSKALAEAEKREEERRQAMPPKPKINRFATVPVIFFAYFFFAQSAFEFDEVRAATVVPIANMGAEFSEWKESKRKKRTEIKYHRGPPK